VENLSTLHSAVTLILMRKKSTLFLKNTAKGNFSLMCRYTEIFVLYSSICCSTLVG